VITRPKLIDSIGNELELPQTFNVRAIPVGRRTSILDIAYSDGGRDYSDGCFTPRRVEISGQLWALTDAELNDKWDALATFLARENLKIQFRGRYINTVRVEEISHSDPSRVDYHISNVALRFLCVDPFWYALSSKTVLVETGGVSPLDINVTVAGNIPVFPEVRITNNADNVSLSLKNSSDGDRGFTFADPAALSGTVLIVNSRTGAVTLDGSDKISAFSGIFVRLLGGVDNTLVYTGASAKVEVFYREAWL